MKRKELIFEKRLLKTTIFLFALAILVGFFILYLFARPIILEEYCMPRAQQKAKAYKEYLIEPPQDLIEAYKHNPDIINEHTQPTPYYVELLRCELQLSRILYPFLHL